MRVYVHGSGRSGREAWPRNSTEDAVFADLAAVPTVDEKTAALGLLVAPGATVIAHSSGAVPAVLAVARRTVSAGALVLIEPAAYDVARGVPVIERHITTMTTAQAAAEEGDLFGYWSSVRPMLFGGRAERSSWAAERETAERFASIEVPWGHGVTADMIADVPTLVLTGGWNDEYEAIAAALVPHGAIHRQLVGHEHRPHDHPDFVPVVQEFLAGTA